MKEELSIDIIGLAQQVQNCIKSINVTWLLITVYLFDLQHTITYSYMCLDILR